MMDEFVDYTTENEYEQKTPIHSIQTELLKLADRIGKLEDSKKENGVTIQRLDKKIHIQHMEIQALKLDLIDTKDKLKMAQQSIQHLNNTVTELNAKFQLWQQCVKDLLPIVQGSSHILKC